MRTTHRDDWRVIVEITPRKLADLGITDLDRLADQITPAKFEVTITPRHPYDFGFGRTLASRNPQGAYQDRCDELLSELLRLPQVTKGRVSYTETHVCSQCGDGWEVLTAADAADDASRLDEHSVEGEPVCCLKAVAEFRAERSLPPLADAAQQ